MTKRSKYGHARASIESFLEATAADRLDADDALLALLVSSVEAYAKAAGPQEAVSALEYELDNLRGQISTHYIRSR